MSRVPLRTIAIVLAIFALLSGGWILTRGDEPAPINIGQNDLQTGQNDLQTGQNDLLPAEVAISTATSSSAMSGTP